MLTGQPILSDNAKAVATEHHGLCFYGKVTTYTDANNSEIAGLSGYGNDFFVGYYIWCVRDAGGGGAAPQGEKTRVTDYVSTDGSLTHNALTANLAVDDEVLLIHPVLIEAVEAGGCVGDIEIFDSFEYPTDAALQGVWIEGGGAANPTRDNATSYEGQYSMQSAIAVSVGHLYRLFPTRNMKTLANIGVASYSTVGGETIQFRLYDSGGNYSYWNITLAAATTWKYHNINPHSAPTGDGGTPADLSDIVEIRLANLTIGSTFNFDFIKFSSLVATKIGIGYDGLDDAVEEASSVRGHLLLINDNVGTVITKTDLLNSASGSSTLNDANPSDTIVPSSLPCKMHVIFDISTIIVAADDFTLEVKVGAAASERVVAYYKLTSDGSDTTIDKGSGTGAVVKQRRIDISDIMVYTGEQVLLNYMRSSGADRNVVYKYICGV